MFLKRQHYSFWAPVFNMGSRQENPSMSADCISTLFNIHFFSKAAHSIFMKKKKRKKLMSDKNDPLGSYTGTPIDGLTPVQDADDL